MAKSTTTAIQGVTVKVAPTLKRRWDALYTVVRAAEDAHDFFERALGEKPRNASRFIRVARFASAKDESKYGVTKLDAALSFIEAKIGAPLAHPPLPIAFEKLRFETKDGRKLTLEAARVADIQAATRALSPKKAAPTSSAERALVETFGRHRSFDGIHFRVRNGLVNILGVPLASLGIFGTVLHETKWPALPAKKLAPKARQSR